jgi:thioredoxin-dependent peroxiredoxin
MLRWLFSAPLPPGAAAPDFSLPDGSGKVSTLSELRGRNVLLVFYPGDDTTVCTRQLCALRDNWDLLETKNVAAFGVNPQSEASHRRFRDHRKFPFPLLVDKGGRVARLYHAGSWVVRRTVYLIAPDGTISFSQRGVPPVDEILKSAR